MTEQKQKVVNITFYDSEEDLSDENDYEDLDSLNLEEPDEIDLVEMMHKIAKAPIKYHVTFSTISVVFFAPKDWFCDAMLASKPPPLLF